MFLRHVEATQHLTQVDAFEFILPDSTPWIESNALYKKIPIILACPVANILSTLWEEVWRGVLADPAHMVAYLLEQCLQIFGKSSISRERGPKFDIGNLILFKS